jgi:hypothetical protein
MKKKIYTNIKVLFLVLPLLLIGLILSAEDYYRIYTKDVGWFQKAGAQIDSVKVENETIRLYKGNAIAFSKPVAQMDSITFAPKMSNELLLGQWKIVSVEISSEMDRNYPAACPRWPAPGMGQKKGVTLPNDPIIYTPDVDGVEMDNILTFTLQSPNETGNNFGSFITDPGPDGKTASRAIVLDFITKANITFELGYAVHYPDDINWLPATAGTTWTKSGNTITFTSGGVSMVCDVTIVDNDKIELQLPITNWTEVYSRPNNGWLDRYDFSTWVIYTLERIEKYEEAPIEPIEFEPVDKYNYVIGTQTIGPTYGLTSDDKLVETAKQIQSMGSNLLKISLALDAYDLPNKTLNFSHELFEKDASFRKVLSMGFGYYFFWVYTPQVDWANGLSEQELQREYDNLYKLTEYLLETCNGTGKAFYFGHWEGDWHLTDMNANLQTVDPVKIQGMIDWYNIRQKAIEDAIAANPGSDVKVYQYSEVNLVYDAKNKGYDRVVNKVLPGSNIDFVSYSSYDAIANNNYANLENDLQTALNYIEQNLKPKSGITGKRVFIGEYGFSGRNVGAQAQDNRSRMVMKASLKWGCPFILYWEMYNNEISGGQQVGYWLINNLGVKQPVYYTHQMFYQIMKNYIQEFNEQNGRQPSQAEYLINAANYFE